MWRKPEIVRAIQKKGGWSSREQIGDLYNDLFSVLAEALKAGETIEIKGFGTFEPKIYKGHTGTNPKSGEKIWVDDFAIVKFTPRPGLKPDMEAIKKRKRFSKKS